MNTITCDWCKDVFDENEFDGTYVCSDAVCNQCNLDAFG